MAALASSTEIQPTPSRVLLAEPAQEPVSRSAISPSTGVSSFSDETVAALARTAKKTVDFIEICLDGDVETVQKLLTDSQFGLSTYCIPWSSLIEKGHFAIVRLLLVDRRSDPNSYFLEKWAMENGIADVKLLLAHPRFSLKNGSYDLIMWACENNQPHALAILLGSAEVELSDETKSCLLNAACKCGHLGIVMILLNDPRFHPTNNAFFLASHFGWTDIVQYLLPKVDPGADDNMAIRSAGNAQVAKLLLSDPRVDPTAKNSDSLFQASAHGRPDVVKVLLDHGRADPAVNMCACLIWAHGKGHQLVVGLLLADERVNPRHKTTYEEWFRDPQRVITQNFLVHEEQPD